MQFMQIRHFLEKPEYLNNLALRALLEHTLAPRRRPQSLRWIEGSIGTGNMGQRSTSKFENDLTPIFELQILQTPLLAR